MVDFHPAAVRFGKPGKLMIAPLGTTEPASVTAAWPAGWVALGYTSEGSTFEYNIDTANVEVAEELDVLKRVTTGRNAHVTAALAELTYRNLGIAFNGGIIYDEELGTAWSFEPPDVGSEVRVMLGWDANPVPANNDLRMIFRQVFQGGTLSMTNTKGADKSTIAVDFQLEKPDAGGKILKIMGAAGLNVGGTGYADPTP